MTEKLSPASSPRLQSIDALRGFDMLWIIGADVVVRELAHWRNCSQLDLVCGQLEHVNWEGLQAYDLIFPLFMFLSGLSIPFSLGGRMDRGDSRWRLWGKILVRVTALVLLGIVYNGGLSTSPGVPRIASVLGQIGIAWGIAASLYLMVGSVRKRGMVLFLLLVVIAVLQLLVPVPGHGVGVLTETGAINTWLDRLCLPGRLHGGTFDPEGLLCILSASALPIAGSLVGGPLRAATGITWKRAGLQFVTGGAFIAAGWLCWRLGYPPVKALWTTTFNLLAIGISLTLFTVFFTVIDVAGVGFWSFPLRVIGMNSLTIYMGRSLVNFHAPAEFLFGRLSHWAGAAGPLVLACGVVLLEWLVLWFFYRKRWFLRV